MSSTSQVDGFSPSKSGRIPIQLAPAMRSILRRKLFLRRGLERGNGVVRGAEGLQGKGGPEKERLLIEAGFADVGRRI